jgi:hypothetical protein
MAIVSTLFVAAMLTFGPAITNVSISSQADEYGATVANLEAAMIEVNTHPEQGIAKLRAALEQLREFAPLLAEDPEALELRTLAELTLARAELARGDRYAASATVDATLETLGGRPLPIERLGPSLGALVEERTRAIEARGTARLRVECSSPCRVLVDERNVGDVVEAGSARELALPLGKHRIWVEDLEPDEDEPLRTTLALDSADALTTLRYPEAEAEPPAPGLGKARSRTDEGELELPGPRRRVAPRWVEVTTLAAGTAAIAAGAVLWALDSRCPRGADPNDIVACPELYDTRNAGIALVSAGFAAGLTGGVMLIVDETRVGDRRGRELGLVWTARF